VVHSFRITVKSISASLIPSATVGTRGNSPILDESTAESRVIGSFLDNSARPKLMTCGMNYETVREMDEQRANLDVMLCRMVSTLSTISISERVDPIRSNANRSQTYDTDRNLSKQTAYLHFHEQHHAADVRVKRKQKKKHVVCRSLENQRIVTL